jgi:two-component system nitrate/nitrite response regulator NarL
MNHNIVHKEQIVSIAANTPSSVATILTCLNTLIRSGISHTLSGTRFVISEEVPEHSSELAAILCLIHAAQATDEVTGTVKTFKTRWPSAQVVLLTDHIEPAAMAQALQAGLDGLCPTAMDRATLIKALELVMLGETFISHAFTSSLLNGASHHQQVSVNQALDFMPDPSPAAGTTTKLSGREIEILRCLTQGFSNKHIARVLGIVEATVKVHVKAICRKVKAENRTQAAMWAQEYLKATATDPLMPTAE